MHAKTKFRPKCFKVDDHCTPAIFDMAGTARLVYAERPSAGALSKFGPVCASAPDIAHLGIANPIAAIWSSAMMLDHLGESEAAGRIIGAIERVTARGIGTVPGQHKTDEITQAVLAALN